MFDDQRSGRIPRWGWAVLVAMGLIMISSVGRLAPNQAALSARFAARPPDPAEAWQPPDLTHLGGQAGEQVSEVLQSLLGGRSTRPLESLARGPRLEVAVDQLDPLEDGVRIRGRVTNIGEGNLEVPLAAFQVRDDTGVVYAPPGTGSSRLQPGQSTTLDLTVPVPPQRGLTLIVTFPPDPPLTMILVAGQKN